MSCVLIYPNSSNYYFKPLIWRSLPPSLTSLQPQHKSLPPAFPVSAKGVTTSIIPQAQESSSPFLLSPNKSNHSLGPTDSTSMMFFIPFPFVYPVASTLVKAFYRCLPPPFQFILDLSSSVYTQLTKFFFIVTPLWLKPVEINKDHLHENKQRLFNIQSLL